VIRLVARCPAKVNLALRVLARRPDGYHELDTVFLSVSLLDELEGRAAPDLTLRCDLASLPAGDDNLVLRAARLLRERYGVTAGAALTLRKHIPVQAGLGGGSSDAAAALRLCARLWGLTVGDEELAVLARRLGADVPFFLVGGAARGRGRGDLVTPLPPPRELALLLGIPPFGISTAEVFGALAVRLTLPGNGVNLPRLSAHKWPEENDFRFMVNDLEAVVFERWPLLGEFRRTLAALGAGCARLSGSGSTVFGVFADRATRDAARERLAREFEEWSLLPVESRAEGIELSRETIRPG